MSCLFSTQHTPAVSRAGLQSWWMNEQKLRAYAHLAVRIGLNLQPRQRLLIIGPMANGGASLEAAPLVRHVSPAARIEAGAQLVETLWGDEALLLARFAHAPRDSFDEFSDWLPRALAEHVERRPRRPVDLRQRSGSAEGRSRPSWSRRCSRRPRATSVRSASTSRATSTNWAVVAAAGGGVGGARLSRHAEPSQQVDAPVGRDQPPLPPRSARPDRRVGDASARARGAHRST